MRHVSILCCLSAVLLVACQAPAPVSQTRPSSSPAVSTPPRPTVPPAASPTASPTPIPEPLPSPQALPSPRFTLPPGVCDTTCSDATRLHGSVTDPQNQALAGARVTVSSMVIGLPYEKVVTADAQGHFSIENAPAGVYLNLRVEQGAYGQHQRLILLNSNKQQLSEINRYTITLLKPEKPQPVQTCVSCADIGPMLSVGSLQGKVQPGLKATVQLRALEPSLAYAPTIQSDENGSFQFNNAPAATPLTLTVEASGYEPFTQALVLKHRPQETDSLIAILIPKPEVTLPVKISTPDCGQKPAEIEVRADGLLIQRSLPAASELFKGAWIEHRVRLSASQLQSLKDELKTLQAPQTRPDTSCPAGTGQSNWQVTLSDGSRANWLSTDDAHLKVRQTIDRLAQAAAPDTSFNRYTAPFWSVMAGECSGTPHLNYALSAEGLLQAGPTTDRSGTVSPLKTRQLSPADAQRLVEMLQTIDPVKAYNAVFPPTEPVSDTADCRIVETLVMTVNGELRAIPWNGSRIYAKDQSSLAFYQPLNEFRQRMNLILSSTSP